MSTKRTILIFFIAIAALFGSAYILGNQTPTGTEPIDQSKREEIQRYIGFEALLARYTTQPYDSSIGTNQTENFVDIGYLLLMFVPILILYLLRRRILYAASFLVIMAGYTLFCLANGIGVDSDKLLRLDTIAKLENFINNNTFSGRPLDYTIAKMYLWVQVTYEQWGISSWVERISGDRDWVTYPFMVLLFVTIGILTLLYTEHKHKDLRWLTLIIITYCFFYLNLAGGIVWYGFLLLIFTPILLVAAIPNIGRRHHFARFITLSFGALTMIWITIGVANRVSGINLGEKHDYVGINMLSTPIYKYNMGVLQDTDDIINHFHPNLPSALTVINSDKKSIVYRVGTSLSYFITDNQTRIFSDTQLEVFREIFETQRTKEKITNLLKASNIKYFVIDLNTPNMDKTPEKTLLAKYRMLQAYVANNPNVKLLATDRIVKIKDSDGTFKQYFHFMGEKVSQGNYAIFEVI